MSCFITDVRPGEPDFLTPEACALALTVHDALNEQELLRCDAPPEGWTHERLVQQGQRIMQVLDPDLALDARLGGELVGSTEI